MTTGQRIKAARKAAGMTQKELGEKLGLSFQSIAQWENDLRNPKVETLQRIANALLVRVSDLTDPVAYDLGFQEGAEMEEWQSYVIDELWKREGYTHSDREVSLINAFSGLDDTGQGKVVEYAEDILPRYRRQKGAEPPAAASGDTDTPAVQEGAEGPQKPPEGK